MTKLPNAKQHHVTTPATKPTPLFTEIRSLIDSARQRAAVAVNIELTLLYWQVGQRIQSELLKGERAEYGQQVLPRLADHLTAEYGKGWTQRNLANMVRFAECFSDQNILYALSAKLSWTHFRVLIGIDDPLKRRRRRAGGAPGSDQANMLNYLYISSKSHGFQVLQASFNP